MRHYLKHDMNNKYFIFGLKTYRFMELCAMWIGWCGDIMLLFCTCVFLLLFCFPKLTQLEITDNIKMQIVILWKIILAHFCFITAKTMKHFHILCPHKNCKIFPKKSFCAVILAYVLQVVANTHRGFDIFVIHVSNWSTEDVRKNSILIRNRQDDKSRTRCIYSIYSHYYYSF